MATFHPTFRSTSIYDTTDIFLFSNKLKVQKYLISKD